ncbi:hypothetical protein NECAME_18375 [Necator americanus]|uniref:Uncharacterized protein n=1 Tax=Necator americanus TaxID=51031 RepID=W2SUG4_NECAM|nr:hypothetical protein NECAME_18375 [Necator americanus]ETN73384.1 hypothetical protein NECAME_18375 [Necator americanus]
MLNPSGHTATYDFAVAVESEHQHAFPFFVWTGYAVILVMSSAVLAHYVSPQTIGSGIPELKTIMRGFILKEYLSFRTLICKMIGLTLSLGSGLPLGKEVSLKCKYQSFMYKMKGKAIEEGRL